MVIGALVRADQRSRQLAPGGDLTSEDVTESGPGLAMPSCLKRAGAGVRPVMKHYKPGSLRARTPASTAPYTSFPLGSGSANYL